MHDAYFFGHVSTGTILRLSGPYPAADGYAEVAESLENHAGEATGGALILARLGRKVALEGNWIGDTPACRRTLEFLVSRGIDCSGLVIKPDYAGVNEIVISDGATRTVFGRYCDLLFTTRQWEMPVLAKVRAARAACVDPSFGEATLAVARAAREAGIPLVSSDAHPDSELAASCAVLVISNEYLRRDFPDAVPEGRQRAALFERYRERCPGLVVFTSGSLPLCFGRRGGPRCEREPFRIDVVDSAGAGDSFRAALLDALLDGLDDEASVRRASGVAAMVCLTSPGCLHGPTRAELEGFLAGRE